MTYDSTFDTQSHIIQVRHLMLRIMLNLSDRLEAHDLSKLESPEKEMFDKFTPLLRDLTYGSPEYKQVLNDMGPALIHHYMENSHHPEHFNLVVDEEIDQIDAYLEDLSIDDPAHKWLMSYRNELESRLNHMSLLDILEMLSDWKAASTRHADGSMADSLEINQSRFKISDQLRSILNNTAKELGWI